MIETHLKASTIVRWVAAMLVVAGAIGRAHAEDVRVFVAGAAQGAVDRIAPAYANATGDRIVSVVDTVGALRDRIARGERPDAVILTREAVDGLRGFGALGRARVADVGRVAAVVIVRRATPVPNVSTHEAFVDTLLAAASIAYVDPKRGSTSGAHVERVLQNLGLYKPLADRLRPLPSTGDTVQAVAEGRAALGIVQATEVIGRSDVIVAGTLPPPDGLETLYTAAAIDGSAKGSAFVEHLTSPAARATLREAGFTTPTAPAKRATAGPSTAAGARDRP